jgi:hypothetical protein
LHEFYTYSKRRYFMAPFKLNPPSYIEVQLPFGLRAVTTRCSVVSRPIIMDLAAALGSFLRGAKMRKSVAYLFVVLLAFSMLWAAQTTAQKPVSSKSAIPAAKPATPPAKPAEPPSKRAYVELSIGELIAEDANRWTDKMAAHVSVGGFVTQVTKRDDGDTDIRICENPRVEGMDRARCIISKCIPKLPCDVPQVGKPITVKGISRYEAKVGTHWWEINPVEQIEK